MAEEKNVYIRLEPYMASQIFENHKGSSGEMIYKGAGSESVPISSAQDLRRIISKGGTSFMQVPESEAVRNGYYIIEGDPFGANYSVRQGYNPSVYIARDNSINNLMRQYNISKDQAENLLAMFSRQSRLEEYFYNDLYKLPKDNQDRMYWWGQMQDNLQSIGRIIGGDVGNSYLKEPDRILRQRMNDRDVEFSNLLQHAANTGDASNLPEGYTIKNNVPIQTGYGGLTYGKGVFDPNGNLITTSSVEMNTEDPADNGLNYLMGGIPFGLRYGVTALGTDLAKGLDFGFKAATPSSYFPAGGYVGLAGTSTTLPGLIADGIWYGIPAAYATNNAVNMWRNPNASLDDKIGATGEAIGANLPFMGTYWNALKSGYNFIGNRAIPFVRENVGFGTYPTENGYITGVRTGSTVRGINTGDVPIYGVGVKPVEGNLGSGRVTTPRQEAVAPIKPGSTMVLDGNKPVTVRKVTKSGRVTVEDPQGNSITVNKKDVPTRLTTPVEQQVEPQIVIPRDNVPGENASTNNQQMTLQFEEPTIAKPTSTNEPSTTVSSTEPVEVVIPKEPISGEQVQNSPLILEGRTDVDIIPATHPEIIENTIYDPRMGWKPQEYSDGWVGERLNYYNQEPAFSGKLKSVNVEGESGTYTLTEGDRVIDAYGNEHIISTIDDNGIHTMDGIIFQKPSALKPVEPASAEVPNGDLYPIGTKLERNGNVYEVVDHVDGKNVIKMGNSTVHLDKSDLPYFKVVDGNAPASPQQPTTPSTEFVPPKPTSDNTIKINPLRSDKGSVIETVDYKGKTYRVVRDGRERTRLIDVETGDEIIMSNEEAMNAWRNKEFTNERYSPEIRFRTRIASKDMSDPVWGGYHQELPVQIGKDEMKLSAARDLGEVPSGSSLGRRLGFPWSTRTKVLATVGGLGIGGGLLYWLNPHRGMVYDFRADQWVPEEIADSIKKSNQGVFDALRTPENGSVASQINATDSANTYNTAPANAYEEAAPQDTVPSWVSGDTIWMNGGANYMLQSNPGVLYTPKVQPAQVRPPLSPEQEYEYEQQ